EQCHLVGTTPAGVLGRETYVAKSAVAKQPLPDAAIAALVGAIESIAGRQGVGGGAVLLDSLGGAVSRVAPSATAFAHRDAFAVAQFIASWNAAGPASVADDMQTWLRDLYATVRSEEHTSELQSRFDLVCRLLLEKKKLNENNLFYKSPYHLDVIVVLH